MFELIKKNLIPIVGIVVGLWLYNWYTSQTVEGWGTSPGTFDQLISSSAYYPVWEYSSAWDYPYYRYMYPFRLPRYRRYYPRPFGYY